MVNSADSENVSISANVEIESPILHNKGEESRLAPVEASDRKLLDTKNREREAENVVQAFLGALVQISQMLRPSDVPLALVIVFAMFLAWLIFMTVILL